MKEKLKQFWSWVKREAHHIRAGLYILGTGIYQVWTSWGTNLTLKDFALKLAFVLGPAFLLWLKAGDQNPTPDEFAKMVAAAQARPAIIPPYPPKSP